MSVCNIIGPDKRDQIMQISVIIPAYNEESYLPKLFASIRRQSVSPDEVIIVDNGSTDNTAAIAKRLQYQVIPVAKEGFSVSKARNAGAKIAKGEIFCFIDADTILISPKTLERIENWIQQGSIGGFFKSLPTEKTWRGRLIWPWINFCKYFLYASSGLIYCTKEAYFKSGGFDETKEIGEDLAFTRALKKLGEFRYDPSITVNLSDRRMLQEGYLKVMWKWFSGAVRMEKEIEYHAAR